MASGIFFAFVTDLWIGDPVYAFHPARLIGQAIEKLEDFYRKAIKNEYLAGGVLAISLPVFVYVLVFYFLHIGTMIHPTVAWVVNMLGIYTAISVHDLRKEAVQIHNDLQNNDLIKARLDVARIVGRDTKTLDEREVVRATVETVAESTVDGIIAPLFYAAIGGAPLALAYKAVNTLDSMVGHLNKRYAKFGYFSAKIDDVVNWIPSRLSYFFIAAAAWMTKNNVKGAMKEGVKEFIKIKHISDIPEAAFAGALDVQLGGANNYEGKELKKTYLGSNIQVLRKEHINKSIRLMMASAWVTVIFCFMMVVWR